MKEEVRLYIVATFEPMNNAPKVLSNEEDISYRRLGPEKGKLWVSQGHENLYPAGWKLEGYGTTVYSRAKRGYSKLREDIACISVPRTHESLWIFVGDEEGGLRVLGHRKKPLQRSQERNKTKNDIV